MGVWTSTTVKRHLKAHLRNRFRLIAMVPYVAIRVPLAANSSYSFLFTAPCILLRGYTHMSAPVSTRKEIFEYLSITNMRWDARPSSFAVFTDGWSRFPYSKCMGNGTFSCVLGMCGMRGSNKVRTAVVSLSKSISDNSGFVFVQGGYYRRSAYLFALAFGSSVHSTRWWWRPEDRLLRRFVQVDWLPQLFGLRWPRQSVLVRGPDGSRVYYRRSGFAFRLFCPPRRPGHAHAPVYLYY